MKNQKGITLIALIITIIVLAILAAVSITSLTGKNGVVTEALQTSEDKEIADEEEQVTVAYMGAAMKNHGFGTTVDSLQTELDEAVGTGKTEVIEENGKLKVKFTDTGRIYVAGDVYTGEVNSGAGSGTGSELNWDEIVEDLASNSQEYLEKAQELGQKTEIENADGTVTEFKDVGIGTDGEVVNLSLWHYYKTDDGTGMSLGKGEDSFGQVGYDEENLVDGKIQGTMPQYIYVASESKVYTVISLQSTFGRTSLKEAPQIPSTIISIYGAFQECPNLTNITIPNGVIIIENRAFYYCTNLSSIIIPSSVTNIGGGTFNNCTSLSGITIPSSVTSIGGSAFYNCTSLSSITIPSSVTSIGESAFYNCTSLNSITIPSSVTSIGESAFSKCAGLESMIVNEGNTKYDSRDNSNAIIEISTNTLLNGCKNTIIPSSVTSINSYAFIGCTGLSSITIPSSVKNIGREAFAECAGLTEVIIENGVTTIGFWAFKNCTGVSSITIPISVTTMAERVFSGWTANQTIKCKASSIPTGWDSDWDDYAYNVDRKANLVLGV